LGKLGEALREYQLHGVAWLGRLAENGLGGILADEMGLGKTVQALAYLSARRSSQPALIVCPSSLLANWRNEAGRFTPELKVLVLEGPSRHEHFGEIAQADIVITSYALLQRDAEKYKAIEFSTAILDEAQHIKNPETQNAQTAFALRAQQRFVLTGTPIENSVRDLWSLMNFALPGYLGSRSDFRERYEQPLARGAVPEVQRRLARRMRPFLLRRKKIEVAKDLPEKIEQVLSCDLSSAQRSAYDGLLREIQLGVTDANEAATRMKMLLGLLRLRQVCCDLRLLGPGIAGKSDQSTKLELLEELLDEAIDGGHRVLVFSQFVAMLSLIRRRLDSKSIAFAYLDGQTKGRQAVVDQFQNDSTIPVFLMSLKAGGVGLNLSAADTVIHFDPWWNYAAEAQATDRAHRIGQTRIVTAYKLIARDTVEEKIVKLQTRKRAASEGTIGSEEPLMSGLTTQDLEELLS
jgi:SNF2 family DNA or RNA helicase